MKAKSEMTDSKTEDNEAYNCFRKKNQITQFILEALTHNLMNFLNGKINLPLLELSIIIFRDIMRI